MTLNSERTGYRENGQRSPAIANANGLTGTGTGASTGTGAEPAQSAQALLNTLCHSATDLAKTTQQPPRRVRVQYGQAAVELEWPDPAAAAAVAAAAGPVVPAPPPVSATPYGAAAAVPTAVQRAATGERGEPPGADAACGDAARYVCSPSVGTFYHAPEPGSPPFVQVGDVVRPGQPIGILEVMKMMSTVEADVAGRVVEVLAQDAQCVEFQQRLIAVEPLGDGQSPEPGRER